MVQLPAVTLARLEQGTVVSREGVNRMVSLGIAVMGTAPLTLSGWVVNRLTRNPLVEFVAAVALGVLSR